MIFFSEKRKGKQHRGPSMIDSNSTMVVVWVS